MSIFEIVGLIATGIWFTCFIVETTTIHEKLPSQLLDATRVVSTSAWIIAVTALVTHIGLNQ